MCGICGQFNYKSNAPADPVLLEEMTGRLKHRGPDDEGYYISGPIGLGFRRLSIIDLEGGRQPMPDESETVWVVFNGEIYNFPEMRKELEGLGRRFKTSSDTEVIVNGYMEWGIDVLDRLNGMFALAIWDVKERQLMLARDRMGIKPLYYMLDESRILFASEVRSILASFKTKPEPDEASVYLFLRYRYTPSPFTVFKGINKLAPGTRLIVKDKSVKVERWWGFKPSPIDPLPDEGSAEEELASIYRRAVKRHLLSDVKLGLLLSGGLDSGLLLALMNESGEGWHTYTAGFGKGFCNDEVKAAKDTARALNAPNFSVELDKEAFEDTLSGFIPILEEPIASSSIVPMYHLCKRARHDVKVALMGQGPDELFGGYRRHIGVHYGRHWRSLPGWFRRLSSFGLSYIPRNEPVRRALYSLDKDDRFERYRQVFSVLPDGLASALFKDGALPPDADERIFESWKGLYPLMEGTDELGGLQFLEVRSSLPDELLLYADKLSMAHGLEVRVPYLDKEIVEFAERLPSSFKVRNASGKRLHKRVCRRLLPKEVLRRKKLGFETPVDGWLRRMGSGMMDRLMDDKALVYRFLRPEAVHALAEEHGSGRSDYSKTLFSLAVLEEWMRAYTA